ncbi:hypothetical protein OXX69_001322 [Metschnikowia pulcherrima]
MAAYSGRTPTLHSLFETKQRISQFGVQTKLSQHRYLAAWDFSTQLCSIQHPGSAPCFFPSDFSFSPGRRSPQSITTLVCNCPSVLFHEEYHKKIVFCGDDVSDKEDIIISHSALPPARGNKCDVTSASSLNCDEISEIADIDSAPEDKKQEISSDPKTTASRAGKWFFKIRSQKDEDKVEKSEAAQEPDSKDLNTVSPHKHGLGWLGARFKSNQSECSQIDTHSHTDMTKPELAEDNSGRAKAAFLRGYKTLKHSLIRKCVGSPGALLLDAGLWINAEDTFISRLTREFYELEKLISDFLEIL